MDQRYEHSSHVYSLPNTTFTSEPRVIKVKSTMSFDLSAESVAVNALIDDLLPSVTPPMG